MGIFDWLRGEPHPGLSRREFFARLAGEVRSDQGEGAGSEVEGGAGAPLRRPEAARAGDDAPGTRSFFISSFPYHDGPVLVPMLRSDIPLDLVPEPDHPTDPNAIRVQWGRDLLGYVPAAFNEEIRERLASGSPMHCRTVEVNPAAGLDQLLRVEISEPRADPESETG